MIFSKDFRVISEKILCQIYCLTFENISLIHSLAEEDKCHPNPCHNNGVCTETNGQYVCTCGEGFKGVNCQGMFNYLNVENLLNLRLISLRATLYVCFTPRLI